MIRLGLSGERPVRARCPRGLYGDGKSKAELDRAFEDLYRQHLRDVYSYAYYRVGNHHDAEDLTEQAVPAGLPALNAPGGSPTGGRCGRG